MAATFLSTATSLVSSYLPSSTPPSSPSLTAPFVVFFPQKHDGRRQLSLCRALSECGSGNSSPVLTKRSLSISFITSSVLSLAGSFSGNNSNANAAILEADDDEELLEKVKKDRKKRLERQEIINSSGREKGYLQDLVYKLSKVGQAIDNNDLPTASSVLGRSTDSDWVQKANVAFTKLSSSPEEKTQIDTFNSSLASLISSVTRNDIESSKLAFVSSASAFEKWTTLTGLVGQLKGL